MTAFGVINVAVYRYSFHPHETTADRISKQYFLSIPKNEIL
jgi:hypothetical protein